MAYDTIVKKDDWQEALDSESRAMVSVFNPRAQGWGEHFEWIEATPLFGGKHPRDVYYYSPAENHLISSPLTVYGGFGLASSGGLNYPIWRRPGVLGNTHISLGHARLPIVAGKDGGIEPSFI
jgi:hypothetical protein